MQEELKQAACSGGSPRDPNEDKKNDYKNHPHGAYHDDESHVKRRPRKSTAPKDGQRCLDYSINYGEAKQRIGIEGDTFIMFQPTSERLYHGYVVEWKTIEKRIQIWLQKHQYVFPSGRVLKQITQTVNDRIIF